MEAGSDGSKEEDNTQESSEEDDSKNAGSKEDGNSDDKNPSNNASQSWANAAGHLRAGFTALGWWRVHVRHAGVDNG
jgi:hypothetical protein